MTSFRRWAFPLLLFLGSIVTGVIGYTIIEGYSVSEAFYMAVITFSTVGFREVKELTDGGKMFTSIYIILNLGIFAYVISSFSALLFEGELRKVFHNFLIGREVKKMRNHIIICGFGRNGVKAAEVLFAEKKEFVIIEKEVETINSQSGNQRYQFVQGDATLDEILIEAGVEHASTVITTLPKDSDNVFITLTVRQLNSSVTVIARASEANSEKKLLRAGAHKVVMPDSLGGVHMAQLITKPYVIEFLEMLNSVHEGNMLLEEISFDDLGSGYRGKSLAEMDIRKNTGVSVIAVKGPSGFRFNPETSSRIAETEVAILLGRQDRMAEFRRIYCS